MVAIKNRDPNKDGNGYQMLVIQLKKLEVNGNGEFAFEVLLGRMDPNSPNSLQSLTE